MRWSSILSVLGLVLTAAAHASAAVSVPLDGDRKVDGVELRADAATGRAWVDVKVSRRFLSGREALARSVTMSVAVPDLAFDPASGVITLPSVAGPVACATFDGEVHPTGACSLQASVETRTVDTGFGAARRDHVVVEVRPRP